MPTQPANDKQLTRFLNTLSSFLKVFLHFQSISILLTNQLETHKQLITKHLRTTPAKVHLLAR